jgi:hypothetical protein
MTHRAPVSGRLSGRALPASDGGFSLPARAALLLATAASLLLLSTVPLAAQDGAATPPDDPRWLPWVGCWEPAESSDPEGSEFLVCVTPDEGGVLVESFLGGEVVNSDRIVADASTRALSEGGCEGTTQALWSSDGHRAYLASDLVCGADARRATRGLFAMGADGMEWIEIQAMATGGSEPALSVRRFHPASRATLALHEHTAPGQGLGLAIQTSRQAASRPLEARALAETTRSVGTEATAALVVEMGHAFDLDARALRSLRSEGVPSEVIDMMVAVTWPDRFQITASHEAQEVRPQPASASRHTPDYRLWPSLHFGYFGSPLWFPYSPRYAWRYGYGYGYRFGGGWYGGGWYGGGWASGPRYIVVAPGGGMVSERGRLTDSGYAPPPSRAGNARPAARSGSQPAASPQSRPAASSAPASRPAASSAPPPAATSGGSTTGARPAQRRGSGGGE